MEEDKIIKAAGWGRGRALERQDRRGAKGVKWRCETLRRKGRKFCLCSESVSGLLPLELLTDPAAEETHKVSKCPLWGGLL